MSTRGKVAIAIVVVGVIGFVTWRQLGRDAAGPPPPAVAGSPAPGSAAPSGRGIVSTGSAFITAVEAAPADPSHTARLEGQVIDEDKQPVAGAQVRAYPGKHAAVSEADGSFAFDALPVGPYRLAAAKAELYSDIASVRLSDTSEPVILHVQRGATLVVRVIDSKGPLAGATVVVDGGAGVVTAVAGSVRIPGLGPSFHHVEVSAPHHATGTLDFRVEDDPGSTVERSLELLGGAAVAGTVVAPDGKPVADGNVTLTGLGDRASATAATDATGAWHLDAVAAGHYRVTATSEIYGPASPLALELDGVTPRAGIEVHVAYDAQVVGTVVDAAGAPVAAATVQLIGTAHDRGEQYTEKTDARGHFEMLGFPGGTFDATARKADLASEPTRLTVQDDQRVEVRLVVVDSTIAGTVVDTAGEPVAEANVTSFPDGIGDVSNMAHDVTDSRGHFDLGGMPPGSYRVTAHGPGQDPSSFDGAQTVAAGTRDLRIVLPTPATVTGRVLLDGQPLASYAILVTKRPEFAFAGAPTAVHAADGRFTKRGLQPGTTAVVIMGDGTTRKTIPDVTIADGKVTDLGDISLTHGARVSGHVRDASGAGVAGAQVSIGTDANRLLFGDGPMQARFMGSYTATTDASGAFLFDGIAPVAHELIWATHPTLGASTQLALPDGDASLDLALVATGGMDGTIAGFASAFGAVQILSTTGGGSQTAKVDAAGEFHADALPAGGYTVSMMMMRGAGVAPPVTGTVVAGQRAQVTMTMPQNTVKLVLTVTGVSCKLVLLLPPDGSASAGPPSGYGRCVQGVATLEGVAPGDYRACVDSACAPITVAATPAVQALPLHLTP